jgi:hypothetical protein
VISDVLAEAVTGMDRYLTTPTYASTYGGALGDRVRAVRAAMLALLTELDTPPVNNPELWSDVRQGYAAAVAELTAATASGKIETPTDEKAA